MKALHCLSLVVLAITAIGTARIQVGAQQVVPASAEVKIDLADFPGAENIKSKWKVRIRLRITTEAGLRAAEKGKGLKMDEAKKVGELIYRKSFKRKSLSLSQNRRILMTIPFNKKIQDRLRSEPWERIDLTTVKIDESVKKKLKEQQEKAQVFLYYVTAVVFDGKTGMTTTIPLNRVVRFRENRSGDFIKTITLTEKGYAVDGPAPE